MAGPTLKRGKPSLEAPTPKKKKKKKPYKTRLPNLKKRSS